MLNIIHFHEFMGGNIYDIAVEDIAVEESLKWMKGVAS